MMVNSNISSSSSNYAVTSVPDIASLIIPLQVFLLFASFFNLFVSFTFSPCPPRFLSMRLNQVCFGLPLGFFTGLSASYRARLAGVSSCSLSKCPSQLNLLLLISLLHFSTFVIS